MKNLSVKYILICVLFFLSVQFTLAQDSEYQEQIEISIEIDTLKMYINNAQYSQAIKFIDRLEPSKELLFQKALCHRYLNNNSGAIEILTALSEEYPDDIPIMLQLAFCYDAISQYSKSIDCYDNLLRIDSTNTYFEVRKADLYYRAEKYSKALEIYTQIDQNYNPNYLARSIAMCYEKLNQQEMAKFYYSKAWDLKEQDAYSANSLVKIQVKEGDYLFAHENSEKFIGMDSTNATMNALNAFVYYNLDFLDLAIERFEKCMQQGDSSLLVNRSLGFSYYLTGRDSLALPFLQQSLLQDTTNNNVLYILGKVNLKTGNYPEAIECFIKLIENITPSNTLFYNSYKDLALSCEKNGEFDRAISAYTSTLRYAQNNNERMELYYSIANIYDKELKNYISAVSYYKQYRLALFNYQTSLKSEEEINDIESKLTSLDEYLKLLTEEAEKEALRAKENLIKELDIIK